MKGLLTKDFCIIAKNKRLYGILLISMIIMVMVHEEEMANFLISYMTILGSSLVLTTISTDEFDKSTTFLMTMPIMRKTYALEKYVFSFLCSFSFWLFSTVISCMVVSSRIGELIKVSLILFFVFSLFQLVMIPVQLKFGGENGRMVIMGMSVAIVAGVLIFKKVLDAFFVSDRNINTWIQELEKGLEAAHPITLAVGLAVLIAICFMISVEISTKIMQKKEY